MDAAKPLLIRFDKIDGFIRVLILFVREKYNFICNRIRYLKEVQRGITYFISQNYAKIKVDSYGSLPQEKTMTFHNVKTLIKSAFNKKENNYYHNIFLEKGSYQLTINYNNRYVFVKIINAILW